MRLGEDYGFLLIFIFATVIVPVSPRSRRKQTRSLAVGAPEWQDGMHFQRTVIVPGGNVIRLSCPADGKPPPKIDWLKDGIYVETLIAEGGSAVRDYTDMIPEPKSKTLKLINAQPKMSGNYTCLIGNPYGRLKWTFAVQIIRREPSRPVIRKRPASQTVVEGAGVTLECRVLSDLPLDIKWIRNFKVNGSFLNSRGAYKEVIKRVNITEYGDMLGQTLSLNNVKQTDTGWYTCIAQNHFGQSHASAWLEVLSKAEAQLRRSANGDAPFISSLFAQTLFILIASYCMTSFATRDYLYFHHLLTAVPQRRSVQHSTSTCSQS